MDSKADESSQRANVFGRLWRTWFRQVDAPDVAKKTADPRIETFRIIYERFREFHDYLALGVDESFSEEVGGILVEAHLTAKHVVEEVQDRLEASPPELLQALRTLLDDELPQLIQQAREAQKCLDSNSVDELFRDGLTAIHVALHRLGMKLKRLDDDVALTRPEQDAGLELRRQARYLRRKYVRKETLARSRSRGDSERSPSDQEVL